MPVPVLLHNVGGAAVLFSVTTSADTTNEYFVPVLEALSTRDDAVVGAGNSEAVGVTAAVYDTGDGEDNVTKDRVEDSLGG
jgi:hypothetical protein